ncbi:site-specific DNA-methyltransferase [Prevotella sp.]|uniref:site-specific DNA-methyltransferase n=1 Tax=Prevotella sp. TaxID=59823 RepID=UPI003AB5B94B
MAQNNKNKLELTWIGKYDKHDPLEPRILIENKEYSYGHPETGVLPNGKPWNGNMLIHGDNLLALKALEQDFSGQIKCIYIDPPYNTGNAFEHYDDNLEHSIWLSLMRNRLEILRDLLRPDGSIWIQIDDEEQAYLKVLCDEIFGRNNFVNMISVNMKNIAGASGGGEDKRLKKNTEYILIYLKDYNYSKPFKPAYSYTPIISVVNDYRIKGKSWKYTSALIEQGTKDYIGSTVDGDGNDIKIYKRYNYSIKSINAIIQEYKISEEDAYKRFSKYLFQTEMPQSSIRFRVMNKVKEIGQDSDLYSIEYIPKTGRNKGKVYEQFYKGESFRLLAWLKDVSEEINGTLYKKDLQGTYWDFVGETKNLTKEGCVPFPNGKKPESLISRIFDMATIEDDIVLDSFLGSGTTAAVAQKMGRRYIGVELGNHAYTHCIPRLKMVTDGTDQGGISKANNWEGGSGFKFYELAPSLLKEDKFGNLVINKEYNADMLAAAMAKQEGYTYQPSQEVYWKQGFGSETDYIYTTTQFMTVEALSAIHETMAEDETLLICCTSFQRECKQAFNNISIKKIPQMLLGRCEFDKDDYSLHIISAPEVENDEDAEEID